MELRPSLHLGRADRLRGAGLCPARRVRSGHRHPVSASSRTAKSAHLAMNTIAPVWDGNETWLVLGGGGLFAVFPLAYADRDARALPADHRHAAGPDLSRRGLRVRAPHQADAGVLGVRLLGRLAGGGTVAQGIALGALVQGIAVEGRAYAGGNWDWLTPFSALTALALVVGYALLGATWLILKTEGETAGARTSALRGPLASRCLSLDRSGQPCRRRSCGPSTSRAGSAGRRAPGARLCRTASGTCRLAIVDRPAEPGSSAPVSGHGGDLRAVLCRARGQLLSQSRATRADHRRSRGP